MMRRFLPFALIVACLATSLTLAADWPNFMGPDRNGIAPDTGLNKDWNAKPPQVVWKVPMGDNGYAGPSVADGKVFIIDRAGENDVVKALSLKDGAEVWRCAYPEGGNDNYGFARTTPSYAAGKLYTLSRFGILLGIDATSGKIRWSHSLMREFGGRPPQWNYSASPLVDGDLVIVQTGSLKGNVMAFNKDTGAVVWTGDNTDTAGYATSTIATILDQRQYVMATGKNVIGVDPASGKTLWSFPWATSNDVNASQPIVEGNFVFITSGYGTGCGLAEITAQGPQPRWANKDISPHFSSPIYYKNFIYSNTDNGGALACMNPQGGKLVWKQGGFEKGGLMIADGAIIACVGNTGDIVMAKADPAGYQELGRIKPLGGQAWTAPILSDGMLIVRNKQTLACIDLK
jgi:outer membrane protein assembly factor BamB